MKVWLLLKGSEVDGCARREVESIYVHEKPAKQALEEARQLMGPYSGGSGQDQFWYELEEHEVNTEGGAEPLIPGSVF